MSRTLTDHRASVVTTGGRYPHRGACTCGWQSAWGYVAEHAAQAMADDHVKTAHSAEVSR